MGTKKFNSLERAKKKVRNLKTFYFHVVIFLIVSTILLLSRGAILDFVTGQSENADFVKWIDWNLFINLGIWALVLIIHGVWLFYAKISYMRNWEERKIKQYMEETEQEIQRL